VNANVRQSSAWRENRLTDVEGGRNADGFNRHIDAEARGHVHDLLNGAAGGAVDHAGRAELPGDVQPLVVEVNHHDAVRRVELGRQQRGESDRAGADNGDGVAGLYPAIQHATFEAGREDVTQHDERLCVCVRRDRVETRIRVRDAHMARLRAVDGVPEDPAAVPTMRVHLPAAEIASSARSDTRDEDAIAGDEGRYRGPNVGHHADALVPEGATLLHRRHIALQDVKVGAANGASRDAHNRIGRVLEHRTGSFFPGATAGTAIDQAVRPCVLAGCHRLTRIVLFHGFRSGASLRESD